MIRYGEKLDGKKIAFALAYGAGYAATISVFALKRFFFTPSVRDTNRRIRTAKRVELGSESK